MRVYIVTGPDGDVWDVFHSERKASAAIDTFAVEYRMRVDRFSIDEWWVK